MNKFFTITFLSVLFTLIFAFPSITSSNTISLQFDPFKVCDATKTYTITITTLTFTPNPIGLGQNLTVNLTGTTQDTIEQNTKLQIQGFVFSFPVIKHEADFCKEILEPNAPVGSQCPIPPGSYDYGFSINIPSENQELENLDELQVKSTRKYYVI